MRIAALQPAYWAGAAELGLCALLRPAERRAVRRRPPGRADRAGPAPDAGGRRDGEGLHRRLTAAARTEELLLPHLSPAGAGLLHLPGPCGPGPQLHHGRHRHTPEQYRPRGQLARRRRGNGHGPALPPAAPPDRHAALAAPHPLGNAGGPRAALLRRSHGPRRDAGRHNPHRRGGRLILRSQCKLYLRDCGSARRRHRHVLGGSGPFPHRCRGRSPRRPHH